MNSRPKDEIIAHHEKTAHKTEKECYNNTKEEAETMKNTTTETTRLMLSVAYTNGNTLKELVNYAHIEGGKLSYTRDRQVYESFLDPSEISLENIASFDLFPVICHGWEPIGEEKPGFYKANGERI